MAISFDIEIGFLRIEKLAVRVRVKVQTTFLFGELLSSKR